MLLKLAVKIGLRSTEVYPDECLEAVVRNEMVERLAAHLMSTLGLRTIKTGTALFYCADLRLINEQEWDGLRVPLLKLLASKDPAVVEQAEEMLAILNARTVLPETESNRDQE